jgi:protein-arginine kinase activator protein McsA
MRTFDGVDEMEEWAKANPDKVSRKLVEAWRGVVENGVQSEVVFRCKPKQVPEPIDVIVEAGHESEALQTLLDEAVEREDYELASEIQELQEKLNTSS